jgi:integrase
VAEKLEWEKQIQAAVKREHRFGVSVRNKRGKCFIQRYYKDIDKKYSATIPINWENGQLLPILNAVNEIIKIQNKSGCNLKEAVQILYPNDENEVSTNWEYLRDEYKKYKQQTKNIKDSTWEGVYQVTLKRIIKMMGENDAPVTGKGILERLQFNDDGSLTVSVGRVKRIETGKSFLEFCVVKKGIDERFLPPPQTIIKELKAVGVKKTKSKNSGKAARIEDDQLLKVLDSFADNSVGKSWRLAFGLLICYGCRPVELRYARPKDNLLVIDYEKVSSKGSTEAREAEPLSPAARPYLHEELLLELSSGSTALPPLGNNDRNAARSLIRALQRKSTNSYWSVLEQEAAVVGQKISCYSLRHSYVYRGAVLGDLSADFLRESLGHSLATHMKSYRDFYLGKEKKARFEEARRKLSLESYKL